MRTRDIAGSGNQASWLVVSGRHSVQCFLLAIRCSVLPSMAAGDSRLALGKAEPGILPLPSNRAA